MLKANSARGRSEVHGELLDFSDEALWDAETLAACRTSTGFVMSPEIVVVGFDPSHSPDGTGDACGIVGVALKGDGVAVVVQDDSTYGQTPVQNWLSAFDTAEDIGASEIVYEDNPSPSVAPSFVRDTLNLALKERRPPAGVKLVPTHASKSKELRARPIAAAYREGRVAHHTEADLGDLEAEMATWVPGKSPSPNRLDATVIALARLLLGERRAPLVLA
jgi:phage terminase large subunit-like protein